MVKAGQYDPKYSDYKTLLAKMSAADRAEYDNCKGNKAKQAFREKFRQTLDFSKVEGSKVSRDVERKKELTDAMYVPKSKIYKSQGCQDIREIHIS